jgi:hypothetical protein
MVATALLRPGQQYVREGAGQEWRDRDVCLECLVTAVHLVSAGDVVVVIFKVSLFLAVYSHGDGLAGQLWLMQGHQQQVCLHDARHTRTNTQTYQDSRQLMS